MKVTLDFQNLGEDSEDGEYLQEMIELAKEAKGFCFFVDRGETCGIQVCHLNAPALAVMIRTLESEHPEIKWLKELSTQKRR